VSRCAVVTGGASGIGRAVVKAFHDAGTHVVVADLKGAIDPPIERSGEPGADICFAQIDVSKTENAASIVALAMSRFGRLDYLVNCAGILRLAPVLDITEEQWDEVLTANLKSTFLCSQAAGRAFVAQGRAGRIVNISSIHAALSEPLAAAYTASKGAIEAFSRTLATELAPNGTTVNCIRPGAIRTPLSAPLYTPEVLAALALRIPQRTIGEPEAIAAAVIYLVSDQAAYCTGSVLTVDGGYSMDGSLPGLTY
jgi:NAD(P)-dependent dehydrogenase (short-subunit alcohol dehydrogenase family)